MPAAIQRTPTDVAAFVGRLREGPVAQAVQIAGLAEFEETFGAWSASGVGYAVRDFFRHGGSRAVVSRIAPRARVPGTVRAICALDAVDTVNILCLRGAQPDEKVPDGVWAPALEYAVARRAFLLIDPPPEVPVRDLPEWVDAVGLVGPQARNAAVYAPRLRSTDPGASGAIDGIAASGAVAGVWAASDRAHGIWTAPAGTASAPLRNLIPVEALTDDVNRTINSAGINAIRRFPGGTVIWGSRTSRGRDELADEYKYVPVRRFALHVEQSVTEGLPWVASEVNGEDLWSRIRHAVGAFLHGFHREEAFAGATPLESYFVKCDVETTTPDDIAAGRVTVIIGFALLKPSEFVVLDLSLPTLPNR